MPLTLQSARREAGTRASQYAPFLAEVATVIDLVEVATAIHQSPRTDVISERKTGPNISNSILR